MLDRKLTPQQIEGIRALYDKPFAFTIVPGENWQGPCWALAIVVQGETGYEPVSTDWARFDFSREDQARIYANWLNWEVLKLSVQQSREIIIESMRETRPRRRVFSNTPD
jgi:hypothetical protein